jgi:hypothetical protein
MHDLGRVPGRVKLEEDRLGILQRLLMGGALEWSIILLPLLIYLLVLAVGVNWRSRPVPVRGVRSFAWLLFGLSGFLLLGPPSWIAHLFRPMGVHWYWLAYADYVILVGLICFWLLVRQRQVLVIYNVDPDQFAEVFQEVLEKLDLPYAATPGRVAFADGQLVLDVDAVHLMHNVTLHWYGNAPALRETIEKPLLDALAVVKSEDNPSCYLLLFSAGGILLFMFFTLATYFLPEPR